MSLAVAKGYSPVCKNYRCKLGEIDIILAKKQTLIFVEVKSRSSFSMGSPAEAVDKRKQMRIRRVANWFINTDSAISGHLPQIDFYRKLTQMRFDVVTVVKTSSERIFSIDWLKNAF